MNALDLSLSKQRGQDLRHETQRTPFRLDCCQVSTKEGGRLPVAGKLAVAFLLQG